jgi:hypothetical protein
MQIAFREFPQKEQIRWFSCKQVKVTRFTGQRRQLT